jgi:hypothetical protein
VAGEMSSAQMIVVLMVRRYSGQVRDYVGDMGNGYAVTRMYTPASSSTPSNAILVK